MQGYAKFASEATRRKTHIQLPLDEHNLRWLDLDAVDVYFTKTNDAVDVYVQETASMMGTLNFFLFFFFFQHESSTCWQDDW